MHLSDHSEGKPKATSLKRLPSNKAPVSQKKRSPTPNQHHMEPVDDLSSLSQSFHSFTEDNAELGDVS